ncbi:MAG: short-chain dehydrogenase [Candidatus Rokuibacteriota bacterium]|nr:MAG: short-chain dehydrogenase [Candidatus Rokubacteria bacterium]
MQLSGKVALVTGAARGIGRGIALALAAEGVRVAVADLVVAQDPAIAYSLAHPADLEETARLVGARGVDTVALAGDVTRAEDARRLVEATTARFGRLDIVVNNAGVLVAGPFEALTEAQWDRMMAVNVKGVFLVTQAALPALRARGGGAMVNISSISGKTGRALTAAYAASKFAVIGLTQALAQELGPANIRVNAVCPGLLRTTMWTDGVAPARAASLGVSAAQALDTFVHQHTPLGREQTPEDIGEAVVYLCRAENVTGIALNVAGGVEVH